MNVCPCCGCELPGELDLDHLRRLFADLLAVAIAAPLPPREGGEREVRLQLIDEAKRYLREELP